MKYCSEYPLFNFLNNYLLFYIIVQIIPPAGLDIFVGRIWPMGRMFDTPALDLPASVTFSFGNVLGPRISQTKSVEAEPSKWGNKGCEKG